MLGVFLDVLGGIDLDAAGHILNHFERLAVEHHAASNGHLDAQTFQLFLGFITVLRLQFGGGGIATEVIRERIALLAQRSQFGAALGNQLVILMLCGVLGLFSHLGSLKKSEWSGLVWMAPSTAPSSDWLQ